MEGSIFVGQIQEHTCLLIGVNMSSMMRILGHMVRDTTSEVLESFLVWI